MSLPSNEAKEYHRLYELSREEWFCTSDPREKRLGSGSGTTWLLEECYQEEQPEMGFVEWLQSEKRVLIHAGGQSRRLPAYAVTGKVGLPIPVFRWARAQRLSQDLLSLQLPLYEKMMEQAPESLHTLIVSGDVYIHTGEPLQVIPEADVVCYGLWVDASLATRHGVFAARRESPDVLDRMLQKPSLEKLEDLSRSHFVLMDIGLWLLSGRAVELLRERSYDKEGELKFYDLYSDFGLALGQNPAKEDVEINDLSVKILPLNGGEFYHYGTSREMISSTLALQNRVYDQRLIMHRKIKPNPAIFTQNAEIGLKFTEDHRNIWIENAFVGSGWQISQDHVITGVPPNDWQMVLPEGVCLDIVPIDERGFALRPYGMDDAFKGVAGSGDTLWMGEPLTDWLDTRGIGLSDIGDTQTDIQRCRLFPCMESLQDMERVLRWMIGPDGSDRKAKRLWLEAVRYSADELMDVANLSRLYAQRVELRKKNYTLLERNFEKSVFYQLDLTDVADDYAVMGLPAPDALPAEADRMQQIHNRMLRARIFSLKGNTTDVSQADVIQANLPDSDVPQTDLIRANPSESDVSQPDTNHTITSPTSPTAEEESAAFSLLRNGLIEAVSDKKRKRSKHGHRTERTASLAGICEAVQKASDCVAFY